MVKAESDASVSVVPVEFPSTCGKANIHGIIWEPAREDAPPRKGVVQIVHGMMEYIDRYDEFARFLVGRGYIVAGHDHLGHGQSVNSKEEWGKLPPNEGKDALIEDTHIMRTLVQARFGCSLPYVLMGHSMGSFVVRAYVARHAEGLAGAIVCGTADEPALKCKAGNLFARAIARAKGPDYCSELVHGMADGAYSKAIKDARTPLDWLNTDPERIDAYNADEACGFMFSVGGYATLTGLTVEIADRKRIALVPSGLPLLFLAGTEDPVGNNGAGVKSAAAMFERAGKNVSVTLYEGMRHEILLEPNRGIVHSDIADWLDGIATGAGSNDGDGVGKAEQGAPEDAPCVNG